MRASKKQVEDAILFLANKFGQEEAYKIFVESNSGLPEIIKLLVYEMFLKKFNPYFSTDEAFENYNIILNYATELKENGFVVHE